MPYQPIIDDSFQRANTAVVPAGTTDDTTLGNGWIGRGGYQINADRLYVYGGDQNNSYPQDSAYRPSSEHFLNGRAIIFCTLSEGGAPGVTLRYTVANGGGYGVLNYNGSLYLSKGVSDSNPSTWVGNVNTGITFP